MIKWHKHEQKESINSNFDKDDDILDNLPYYFKKASRIEVEKVLKGIKEVKLNGINAFTCENLQKNF